MKTSRAIFAAIAMLAALPAAAAEITSSVDAAALSEGKSTKLGLYLTPTDAHRALTADPGIVFVDVRDPLEINFVGGPAGTDAIVPLALATHRFDAEHGGYALVPNPNFVAEVEAIMEAQGKDSSDPVFVICRSGGRSAAAANALAEAGYTNVWSVVEGFQGGTNKETGARDKEGWQNAGLPWSAKIDPAAAWQPPAR